MIFGSTLKNLNLLTLCSTMLTIAGIFYLDTITWTNVATIGLMFYILNILGIWITLHRYYSHKSFEFGHPFIKWSFTVLSILAGRGSPLGWVYIHRQHHAYSDTEKDPHSPKHTGYNLFAFRPGQHQESETMKIFLVKELMTPVHLFLHKWYMAIILLFVVLLAVIDLKILYFGWVVPILLIQISQYNFNYFGHMHGYRNFNTKDDSRNNKWLFPAILGEAWHNNHHGNPNAISTQTRWWEFDPAGSIIRMIKK